MNAPNSIGTTIIPAGIFFRNFMIMGFFLLVFILFSHVSTRFFRYSAQRNIVPKRGRSKFPSRGNCTSRTNALYLFLIHLSRNCQATASFSAIVHEPRLQNLSKKSIKSLLSETLFHRMRFQICPPLHAFRSMEMDAVGGQFFSQAIVLHGHGLRHIQIQAFAQCVYASASKRWTSPRCLLGALVNTDSTVAPTA